MFYNFFLYYLPKLIRENFIYIIYNKIFSECITCSPDGFRYVKNIYSKTEAIVEGYDNLNDLEWFLMYFGKFIVFIRLWILKEPYFYIIINFILISFLLTNKYYILIPCISIFLALSKFMFYFSDFNYKELKESIKHLSPEIMYEAIKVTKKM